VKTWWIWTRSERTGIWVFSTRLRKEWGNDWHGTRELKRAKIFKKKIQHLNNLMGLCYEHKYTYKIDINNIIIK
jgi:hypothetical protein